jgi:hypothetical protein
LWIFWQKETSKLKRKKMLQIPFFKRKKLQTNFEPKNQFSKISPQFDIFCCFGANFHQFSKVYKKMLLTSAISFWG